MKVLVVHNFHRPGSASGDDQVFLNETNMLKNAGIEVLSYTRKNEDFDRENCVKKAFSILGMCWSLRTYKEIRRLCREFRPDIIHVHTFFPLISPAVFSAAQREGVKVVQTIHDTRYICPNAASLCKGKLCNKCMDGRYARMVKYRCYKNSRVQSGVAALIFSIHRRLKTFHRKIDCYICLNDTQMWLLEKAGFSRDNMKKKYNSVSAPSPQMSKRHLPERFVTYCGRIGEEKGIPFLCNTWKTLPDIPLVIMGDGPLKGELEQFITENPEIPILFLGYVPHDECQAIMSRAEFVILPSMCYEGCSMVVLEAFALKKPVVASEIGFMKEAIGIQEAGFVFKMGEMQAFKSAVRRLWENPQVCAQMGKNAFHEYETKYTREVDIDRLLGIYREVLGIAPCRSIPPT